MFKYQNFFTTKNIITNKGVSKYRCKTIKSGDMLECEIYPIWNRSYLRRAKLKISREEQKNLNNKNRRKKIVRLVNTNFTKKDMWLTVTYDKEHNPQDLDEAQKNVRNYLRKIKRRDKDVKYLYVTEGKKNSKRFHHHIFISTKLSRDEIENLWQYGARKEAHRLQPDEFYLTGIAIYTTKAIKNKNQWGYSKNLKQPKITTADTKLTKRQAQKITEDENAAISLFEKLFNGYQNLKTEWFSSNIVNGVYITTVMRKIKSTRKKR